MFFTRTSVDLVWINDFHGEGHTRRRVIGWRCSTAEVMRHLDIERHFDTTTLARCCVLRRNEVLVRRTPPHCKHQHRHMPLRLAKGPDTILDKHVLARRFSAEYFVPASVQLWI